MLRQSVRFLSSSAPPQHVPLPSFSLSKKRAVITGASSGLGDHFARLLAAAGASVAVGARRVDRCQALADELKEAGAEALPFELDVTDPTSVKEGLATVAGEFGGVDILVNNAGVAVDAGVFKQTEDDWDFVMDTNLKGPFLVAQEAARMMADAGSGGKIVNIASVAGSRTLNTLAPYCASKAGVIHLTRCLALELARYDIQVNALAPGYVKTAINAAFWDTEGGKRMISRIPQRRIGKASDLDGAFLLMCGPASDWMTGAVVDVDGGHACMSA